MRARDGEGRSDVPVFREGTKDPLVFAVRSIQPQKCLCSRILEKLSYNTIQYDTILYYTILHYTMIPRNVPVPV